jgi:hypothetical protein
VRAGQLAGEAEAQAVAGDLAGGNGPEEALEKHRLRRRGDAGSGIRDPDDRAAQLARGFDPHRAAVAIILHRVHQQVEQDL